MKALTASDFIRLSDLSSDRLAIRITPDCLTFRLARADRLKHGDVLADAGLEPSADYNPRTGVLTCILVPRSELNAVMRADLAGVVAVFSGEPEQLERLEALARTLRAPAFADSPRTHAAASVSVAA